MIFPMVYNSGQIFLPLLSQFTRVTDRRTDKSLIARPRLHFMQRGKNRVKNLFERRNVQIQHSPQNSTIDA